MKLLMKIFWSVVIVSVICTIIAICFVQNPSHWMTGEDNDQSVNMIDLTIQKEKISLGSFAATGSISVHAPKPEVPVSVPIFKGIIKQGDILSVMTGGLKELLKEKADVTSEQDAPNVAVKALEQYGGLPPDAVLSFSKTNYAEYYDRSTWEVVERHPVMTTVAFNRMIQGMPVVGQCDGIMVDLGENDTALSISKIWRSLEYTGKNVSVISPEKAIDKIRNGESIDPSFDSNPIQIHTITLGYYEKSRTEPEITLEPVWVFYGNTSPKSSVKIIVYARQFANFTATPTYGQAPLAVTFTDTSDASPIKWNWDFGDGTNSTVQNPVHTYTTAGTYTVSLRAWNDLGSDTMTKTSHILIGKKAIVTQTGTKLDELIATINAMNLENGIKNSLVQKLENAKAKNTDALTFIDQTKEKQANDMLSAEDNLMQAFMNEVQAQTGKAIPTGDAAKLNSGATEIRGLIQEAIGTPI